MSCIENLWAILKVRVSEREPQNIIEMEKILQEEWSSINQSTIDALIRSTPERFKLVEEEHGKAIGHLLHKIRKPNKEPVKPQTKEFIEQKKILID